MTPQQRGHDWMQRVRTAYMMQHPNTHPSSLAATWAVEIAVGELLAANDVACTHVGELAAELDLERDRHRCTLDTLAAIRTDIGCPDGVTVQDFVAGIKAGKETPYDP